MKKLAPKRRVLIVGEGRETEYNYFVGFRKRHQTALDATATSIKVVRGRGGNARNIVEHAITEAGRFEPDRNKGDRVFLLMDTEGPGRAPELPAATTLAGRNDIEIVHSCPAFEYWLLCHFDRISRAHRKDCDAVIIDLNKKWSSVCKAQYDKADQDIFGRLEGMLDRARAQALEIDLYHQGMKGCAVCTNPSSQVYRLIAILIGVQKGEKCPVAGTWRLIGNPGVTRQLEKGVVMPAYNNSAVCWQLSG